MIHYDEDSLWPLLFRLNGSVYFRAATFAVPASCICFCLVLFERWAPGYRQDTMLDMLNDSTIWSMSTAALLFMVSFRTKQGLARFWEGTGLLHQMKGEWFDTVSNCVTFTIAAGKDKQQDVERFRHTIVRLMSLCHGSALEEISGVEGRMETIDVCGLNTTTLRHLKDCVETHRFNKVEVLLHLLQSLITDAHGNDILKIPPPILSRVYQTISRGYVNLLNTKKITDTKFPFPYVQLIVFLLLLHMILTPIIVSVMVDSLVLAPIVVFIPTFGTHALNFIAIQLEDPFGEDDNDLPLAHFQAEMNKCLLMLLHPRTDIIAAVSDSCIMDFFALKDTVCLHDAIPGKSAQFSDDDGVPAKRTSVKLFDPDFTVVGTRSSLESFNDRMHAALSPRGRCGAENDADASDAPRPSSFPLFATESSEGGEASASATIDEGRADGCLLQRRHPLAAAPYASKVEGPQMDEGMRIEVPKVSSEGHVEQFEAANLGGIKRAVVGLDKVRARSPAPVCDAVARPGRGDADVVDRLFIRHLEEFSASVRQMTETMEAQLRDMNQRLAAIAALDRGRLRPGEDDTASVRYV